MTSKPFVGKRGLSANNNEVIHVAAPSAPDSAVNKEYAETYIRLNQYDPSLSYPAGRSVIYGDRIRRSNTTTTPGVFNESEWDRLLEQQYPRISTGGLTLQNQDIIFVNNQATSPVFNLPTAPVLGTHIELVDYLGLSNVNVITVQTTDGKDIQVPGRTAYYIETQFDHVTFYYDGNRWIAKSYSIDRTRVVGTGITNASAGETLFVRNTSATDDSVINLPKKPVSGTTVSVKDVRPNRSRLIKVYSEEYQINSQSSFVTVQPGDEVWFTFVSATVGWTTSATSKFVPSIWSYVTVDTSVNIGQSVLVHSGSGPVLITLPSFNLTNGSSIRIVDYGRQSHLNAITVRSVDRNINGSADDYVINMVGEDVSFVFVGGEWKSVSQDSVSKNVWSVTVSSDNQPSVSFPLLNELSELYLNSARLVEGVDYTANFVTNTVSISGLRKGDIVTNVTFSSIGMSTTAQITKIVDEKDNRCFFRLRSDGRIERRKLEGLSLDRTEVITNGASIVSKCCSALFYLESNTKVQRSENNSVATVYEALAGETIDTLTSFEGTPIYIVRTATEWRFSFEETFRSEVISVVEKIDRRGDYIMVQLDTETRVYDLVGTLLYTVSTSAPDVYLNENGSVIAVDTVDVSKHDVSGVVWTNTTAGLTVSCKGEDGEVVGVNSLNEIIRVDSTGVDSTLYSLPLQQSTVDGVSYAPEIGGLYLYNQSWIELVDIVKQQYINGIQLYDNLFTLNLEISR